MTLETSIDDLALESAEIATAIEITHTDIHADIGFVVRCVMGETTSRHLCRKFNDLNNN